MSTQKTKLILIIIALLQLAGVNFLFAGSLEDDFKNPSIAARPYVWWHWMGPNFSKAGITKDLEVMKASGIGGATILNISSAVQNTAMPTQNNPWPEQTFRSQAYWDAIRHAAAEAERLGLELGLHNTPGYSSTGGSWIDEEMSMQKLYWSSQELDGGAKLTVKLPVPKLWKPEQKFYRDVAVLAAPADKPEIALTEVQDLTGKMTPSGDLTWDAQAGRWIVYRIGHGSTGRPPTPVPDDIIGKCLEADKMSVEATRLHWENVINPLRQQLGPLFGKSLRHFLIDSYEAGLQNWTPVFRDEFKKRKGYDPLPWLLTMGETVQNIRAAKRVRTIASMEQTERFEWDYRDMIEALFYDNGWKPAADMIHAAGCKLNWEAYGGPFNSLEGSYLADVPMGELWIPNRGGVSPATVGAGRAAGGRLVGAEACSGAPKDSRWTETPAMLKTTADRAFGMGVNRLFLHHWVHQPFDDRYKPGMNMGWWGTHFGRNQTWAELGKEFYRYLGRCQALLQRGESPVDYVSVGNAIDRNSDAIPQRVFLNDVRVESGKIVLPSGRRYEFICVTHDGKLQPEILRQIKKLLASGASVVAKRPERSPSLANYPACDAEVKALSNELWGGDKPVDRLYTDVAAAVKALGIVPAVTISSAKNVQCQYRRDAEADWFFIANVGDIPASFTASFRVVGWTPELWNAETGTIEIAPAWREKDGRTEVELVLGAVKTVFVVFRKNSTAVKLPEFKALAATPVNGPWSVELKPMVGDGEKINLEKLASLTEQENPDVKYFSGTAIYRTVFRLDAVPPRLDLNLGDVRDLASVKVNGKDLGVVWHPPYVRNIAIAAKTGENTLELAVVNTWHNRLVGDEQYPADFEWDKAPGPGPNDAGIDPGRAMKAYPDWFLKNQARPEKGRKAFTIWYYHRKDTPLIPAGLLGPVTIQAFETIDLLK